MRRERQTLNAADTGRPSENLFSDGLLSVSDRRRVRLPKRRTRPIFRRSFMLCRHGGRRLNTQAACVAVPHTLHSPSA
ncbi:hypothetical protein [Kingella potus]|uniref:hypothetical protein n=1 Tax=Kingella potus TaxID=265175 RepID=UPI001FD3914E|nr:hypothetical protein [Kingella potus]UOP00084.1 hypothetical protein LVJ84_08880 [Kingella potus]